MQQKGSSTEKSIPGKILAPLLPQQPSLYFPGLMWNQTPWQIAHRSFHLNNRLLGWGFARDGWGTCPRLYSECVPGLIWSMLQQSESPVACSAPSRAVRYASGLWQPGGSREDGLVKMKSQRWCGAGSGIIGWGCEVDLANDSIGFVLMRRLCRLRTAQMCLILTSLPGTTGRLPKLLFASRGRMQ